MSRISVIVPFFNAKRYIEGCVEGLCAQDYPAADVELWMVDNNSTDGSADLVRNHPRIRLLSHGKQGSYAARNLALRQATGDLIAFTDADCVPMPQWLTELESALRTPGVGLAVGSHVFGGSAPIVRLLADYENEKKAYVYGRRIPELYYGHTNNMAVHRWLIESTGGFAEVARGADTIFIRTCVERHSPAIACYAPRASVRHLEIETPAAYWHKAFIYGASRRRLGARAAQALNMGDRFRIVARTVRANAYSPRQAAALLGALAVGLGYWGLGSASVLGARTSGARSSS